MYLRGSKESYFQFDQVESLFLMPCSTLQPTFASCTISGLGLDSHEMQCEMTYTEQSLLQSNIN